MKSTIRPSSRRLPLPDGDRDGRGRRPRHQPRRHGYVGRRLPGLQPVRQRRLAQGQPDSRRPVLLGILHASSRSRTARACTRSWRRSRRPRTPPAPTSRRSATSMRRCMDEAAVEAPGTDAAQAASSRAIDKIASVRRPPGRDRAAPDDGRQRGLPLRLRAGPPERERGHRRAPTRAASGCPTATTTSRPTTSRRSCATKYLAHVTKMFALLGDDAGEGRREREDGDGARDAARRRPP